jgi:peptidoglycan/LPS O-acetylase OafA/YrhL
VAPPTPAVPTRDRYFDVLRVLAIVRVSVFHMFPFVILELAFPSMGVMFALAGSLIANSLTRKPHPLTVIRGRVRRLLPALWVLAAVVVPAMFLVGWEQKPPLWHLITWLIPFADPPSSTFGTQAAEVLWYLVTYLWLVLLSPILLRLYRKARLVTILLPVAAMAALTVWPVWPGDAVQEVVTDVLVFAACWIIGFAHRDGTLRRVPAPIVIPLAVACVAGTVYWSHTHPDAGGLKYIPVAYAVYNIGFVLALLRWNPSLTWLSRRPALTKWVSLINARAVTIYLWNNIAIALCYPLGDAVEVWRLGRFFEVGYALTALAVLCNAVLLFGWVEDLAARRKPRFLPWPAPEPRPVPAPPPARAAPTLMTADTAVLVGAVAGSTVRATSVAGADRHGPGDLTRAPGYGHAPAAGDVACAPAAGGVARAPVSSSDPTAPAGAAAGAAVRAPGGGPTGRSAMPGMRERNPGAFGGAPARRVPPRDAAGTDGPNAAVTHGRSVHEPSPDAESARTPYAQARPRSRAERHAERSAPEATTEQLPRQRRGPDRRQPPPNNGRP